MWYLAKNDLYVKNRVRITNIDGSLRDARLIIPKGTLVKVDDAEKGDRFMSFYPEDEKIIRGFCNKDLESKRSDANSVIAQEGELFSNSDDAIDVTEDMKTVLKSVDGEIEEDLTEKQTALLNAYKNYQDIYKNEEELMYPEILRKYSTVLEDEYDYLAWAIKEESEYTEEIKEHMQEGYIYTCPTQVGTVYGFPKECVKDGFVNFSALKEYQLIDPEVEDFRIVSIAEHNVEQRNNVMNSFNEEFKEAFEMSPNPDLYKVPNRIEEIEQFRKENEAPVITNETDIKEENMEQNYSSIQEIFTKGDVQIHDGMMYGTANGVVYGINEEAIGDNASVDLEKVTHIYMAKDGEVMSDITTSEMSKEQISKELQAGDVYLGECLKDEREEQIDPVEAAKKANAEIREGNEETLAENGVSMSDQMDQKKFDSEVEKMNEKSALEISKEMKEKHKTRLQATKDKVKEIDIKIDAQYAKISGYMMEVKNAEAQLNTDPTADPGIQSRMREAVKGLEDAEKELANLVDSRKAEKQLIKDTRIQLVADNALYARNGILHGVELTEKSISKAASKVHARDVEAVNIIRMRILRNTESTYRYNAKVREIEVAQLNKSAKQYTNVCVLMYKIKHPRTLNEVITDEQLAAEFGKRQAFKSFHPFAYYQEAKIAKDYVNEHLKELNKKITEIQTQRDGVMNHTREVLANAGLKERSAFTKEAGKDATDKSAPFISGSLDERLKRADARDLMRKDATGLTGAQKYHKEHNKEQSEPIK